MKKNYIEPQAQEINVTVTSILAVSDLTADPSQTSGTMDAKEAFPYLEDDNDM